MSQDVVLEFRKAMRLMAASVCIVSCKAEGGWAGMTATSVTSVSMDPAAVLVCINSSASIHPHLEPAARFCVNVLKSSQVMHAAAFGGRLKGVDRFVAQAWGVDDEGTPFLDEAQANLFCLVDHIVPYGTHSIVIARVGEVRTADIAAPLIYHDGQYATPVPLVAVR